MKFYKKLLSLLIICITLFNCIPQSQAEQTVLKGIDISYRQGDIDWNSVKNSGIDFAIIRCGFTGTSNSFNVNQDVKFEQNITNAKNAGLKVGIYYYSQALTVEEAQNEANFVISLINKRSLDLPIFYDIEASTNGRFQFGQFSSEECMNLACAFCSQVAKYGYKTGVYSSISKFSGTDKKLDAATLENLGYSVWVARYSSYLNGGNYSINNYTIWQYSNTASIDGISTPNIDCDIWYYTKDLSSTYVEPVQQNMTNDNSQNDNSQNNNVYINTASVLSVNDNNIFVKATNISSLKSNKSKKLTVKYKKVSSISGYQIQYSLKKDFSNASSKRTSAVSYTIKNLKKSKKYYVRVRAYKIVNNTTYYSNWSKIKSVKVK